MTRPVPVPPLRGVDPGTGPAPRRRAAPAPSGLPRRTVLRAATALGTAAGMAALGVFPAVRRAHAEGYDIYGACPSYATDHNCSPGCGPSTIFGDACNTGGAHLGFHKDDGTMWMLRPNQCFNQTFDGWLWRYQGACGSCGCFVERRCHDGYRQTSSGWVRSICRWNTECGCQAPVDWPTLSRGAAGANVSSAQELLNQRGATLTVDGQYGPLTEAAVLDFQQARQLPASGVIDAGTWTPLVVTVRRNDRSVAVGAAQRQLNKYGYALAADGVFGQLTEGAARDFQRQSALSADGVIGPNTWRTLTGGAGT
jgi:hypothetical protein